MSARPDSDLAERENLIRGDDEPGILIVAFLKSLEGL